MMTKEDQEIFTKTVNEIKPWTYEETLKYYEHLQQEMAAKGAKIYKLTEAEKSRYLKDAYVLWPEVREISGEYGNKFVDIMENFRDK